MNNNYCEAKRASASFAALAEQCAKMRKIGMTKATLSKMTIFTSITELIKKRSNGIGANFVCPWKMWISEHIRTCNFGAER